jgi:hypothetical protein
MVPDAIEADPLFHRRNDGAHPNGAKATL